MLAPGAEFLLAFRAHDLNDAALDNMGRIAFDEAVDHAGAADEADLADGERKQRAFDTVIQLTAGHHLGKAVGLAKLLLQFLLIEQFPFEGLHLHRLCRESVAAFRDLRQFRYGTGTDRKLFQP